MSWLQETVAFAVPMAILLGLLIFVHELGHFLVAKYYKVRVEVFSLGFGPKLFKFKKGDTTYAISAIPLGGYVKMYGDDPSADVPSEQRSVSFTHKPVGQRIAIVLAGPLMNFFFAILVFLVVAFVGEPILSPIVGDVQNDTPAYAAGFRAGDTVTKAANEPVQSWEDLQRIVEKHPDDTVAFEVQRPGETAPVSFTATPKLVRNKNVLSWSSHVGEIDGLTYSSKASVVGVTGPETPAAQAGLKTGDIVTAVNGEKLDKWRDFTVAMAKHLSPEGARGGQIALTVERLAGIDAKPQKDPEALTLNVAVPEGARVADSTASLAALGIEWPETYIAGFGKKSPAEAAGLRVGDKIVSIDGQAITTFKDITTRIQAYRPEPGKNQPLNISVLRDGQAVQATVTPRSNERMSNQGKEEQVFEIGYASLIQMAQPTTFQRSTTSPVEALQHGMKQTMHYTSMTVLSFVRLFQAQVSAKNVGGFISIGIMAKRSWQSGISHFLNIMALISINLFILNLLPVPILDGGHLVFFSIEALRGAPVSMRKLEIAQQVGLILLLGLMVFALFNDVTRLFN